MTYFLVLILAMTNQRVALPTESEEACKVHLEAFVSGRVNVITLEGGVVLPVVKPIGCLTDAQINAMDGRGA